MRMTLNFNPEFDELYNSYHNSEKGRKLLEIEGISRDKLDVAEMSRQYFTKHVSDVSIDGNANANEEISVNNYASEITKGILKLEGYFLLWHYTKKRFGKKRADELIRAIWDGDVYFHDSSGPAIQQPYCFSYSTAVLMTEGRPYGQLQSLPPKRADSFIAQVIECTMDMSQDFAGAITPADLIINYAWYAKKENLDDYRMLNDLQKFVHVINNKFRVGAQSPFVNISLFDRPNLEKVFGDYRYPDGTEVDIDFVMHIQKLFGEWFAKGDVVTGLPYRFPVVTLNLTRDDDMNIVDEDFLDWASEHNKAKGCFNIYVNDGTKLASCCRLVNDQTRMQYRTDSFGNGGLNIGSHRVVTINLPRVALRAKKDMDEFFAGLDVALEDAKDLLLVHREEILTRRINSGLLKFYKPLRWFSLSHLFSTIGIIGIYEMVEFMGLDIMSEDGQKFVEEVLLFIEDRAIKFSEENKCSFNVEEIPGESAAPRLAKKDRLFYQDQPFELYSNQYIPLIADAAMPERIKLTGKFMDLLSGGGILHLNIKEVIRDKGAMKKLIEYAVRNGVSHLAVNYGYGICENGHTSVVGTGKICPICGGNIGEWLTRIIGYFTKTTSWNQVRREYEYERRKFA